MDHLGISNEERASHIWGLIAREVEMCDYTNSAVISVWPSNEPRVLTLLIRISSLAIGISKRYHNVGDGSDRLPLSFFLTLLSNLEECRPRRVFKNKFVLQRSLAFYLLTFNWLSRREGLIAFTSPLYIKLYQ